MTKHRTTPALLVVVALLLGLNLTLLLSPPEAAGEEVDIFADNARLRVIQVSLSPHGGSPVFRLWSDGVIVWAVFASLSTCEARDDGHPWNVIPEEPLPLPPGIRVIEIFTPAPNGPTQLIRVLSDGNVQRNVQTTIADELVWCGWQDVPAP